MFAALILSLGGCLSSWTLQDGDGDGVTLLQGDCNDQDGSIYPGAEETWYDGVDQDCDGANDYDADGDGFISDEHGGDDCDDEHDSAWPGNEETWYDGIDGDCDGGNDYDQDGDFVEVDEDCDDTRSDVYPGAPDAWYDGLDADCAGNSDYDRDGDGADSDAYGGTDCDDTDADWGPDADDPWYDCFDHNCDGNDGDQDGDGYVPDHYRDSCPEWKTFPAHINAGDCWDDPDDRTEDYTALNGQPDPEAEDVHPGSSDAPYDAVDGDCSGDEGEFDADGDGFDHDTYVDREGNSGTDCDDDNWAISPAADEVCDVDNVDEDCNGVADSDDSQALGQTLWYQDYDRDGYGDASQGGQYSCDGTSTWDASSQDDCDDYDADTNPGATEYCDGHDDDCDGETDEDDASDTTTFYADDDGDGYGDTLDSRTQCDQPSGYVEDDTDCDDEDSSVNPGQAEVCDEDDVDEDCSGLADDDDSAATGQTTFYADDDLDTYGDDSDTSELCDASSAYPLSVGGDCDDTDSSVYDGAEELCDGQDNACDGTLDSDEKDNDGDKTVECEIDAGGWDGSSAVTGGDDCNDSDATVYDGASELCDGQDNDCDGSLDSTEQDADGDGHVACAEDTYGWDGDTEPSGYDDCDDDDATVYDGASELCDGQDNDCDGSLDSTEQDTDGDGAVACTIDSGGWDGAGTMTGDDCDETDATVYDGAAELCDGLDNDCDGSLTDNEVDGDGDGYVECTLDSGGWDGSTAPTGYEDCDDTDSTVSPVGTEVCDGQDNDCDGSLPTDESDKDGDGYSACTWDSGGWDGDASVVGEDDCDDSDKKAWPGAAYAESSTDCMKDADADGYGSDTVTGSVVAGTDCDDSSSRVYPGKSEVCDVADVDEDCDGLSDDDDSSASGQTEWSVDSDGDGYGDVDSSSAYYCDGPSGWASPVSDCDDSDASINPGAAEVCKDAYDQDCDDVVNEGCYSAGDLVITEIMYNPAYGEPTGEFIEIRNKLTYDVYLDGWTLEEDGNSFTFGVGGVVVPASDYAVFCYNDATFTSSTCDYEYGSDINGDSDQGSTYNSSFSLDTSGRLTLSILSTSVDQVNFNNGGSWPDSTDGYSIQLGASYETATYNDDGSNWCRVTGTYDSIYWESGSTREHGTPGTPASCTP